jgi:hypothetical protein
VETHDVPFNIFIDTHNHNVKVVIDEAILRSSTASLGKSIKKFDVQFVEKEC